MRRAISRIISACLVVFLTLTNVLFTAAQTDWTSKVDPWLLSQARSIDSVEFLVYFKSQADLSRAAEFNSKAERGNYVYIRLRNLAETSQKPVIHILEDAGVEYSSFWVANMIWVRGNQNLIRDLALRPDIAHIYANPKIQLEEPSEVTATRQITSPEWNLTQVNAPEVWARGFTGEGVVVGGQDTGYEWDHPALINQYRGWDGESANHDYSWHDAIHEPSSTNSCGDERLLEPCDDYSHGTHTMGTIVGDDGEYNQIGMAPGAKWIGCRNMDEGVGSPATYTECYQWFIAPTRVDGSDPDPSKAPDVINNSWSCPTYEGCNPESLRTVVQSVVAAGIVTVHSAGNSGPSCETVNTPAAIYPESFTVGSTDNTDMIASNSSQGPVMVDGSGLLKPNVTAPGVMVRSSILDGGYGHKSGTSMAAPHVAGLVALLISADPSLAGQVDLLRTVIQDAALPRPSIQDCGGIPGSEIPNNTYGWGRIDALAALLGLPYDLQISKSVDRLSAVPGDMITYTLTVTSTYPSSPATDLVMTDTLPTGLEFISATGNFDISGQQIRWERISLEPDQTWQEQLVVRVLPEISLGTVTNDRYSVSSREVLETFGEPVTTIIHILSLEKSAPESSYVEDSIPYTLTVNNMSLSTPARELVLTDTLPAGSTLDSASGSFSLIGSVIRWERGSLPPGGEWTTQMRVTTANTGYLTNQDYGVRSADTGVAVPGEPVRTLVWSAGLDFTGQHHHYLLPGTTITTTVELQNTGSLTDTFAVTVLGHEDWVTLLTPDPVTLSPMESAVVILRIAVPADAPFDEIEEFQLIAPSENAPFLYPVFEIIVHTKYIVFYPYITR